MKIQDAEGKKCGKYFFGCSRLSCKLESYHGDIWEQVFCQEEYVAVDK